MIINQLSRRLDGKESCVGPFATESSVDNYEFENAVADHWLHNGRRSDSLVLC